MHLPLIMIIKSPAIRRGFSLWGLFIHAFFHCFVVVTFTAGKFDRVFSRALFPSLSLATGRKGHQFL